MNPTDKQLDAEAHIVVLATTEDRNAWLDLAAEVETLFEAAMAGDPGFQVAVDRNIARGYALCVRHQNGPAGSGLSGAMFWRRRPDDYDVSWMAVAQQSRRKGVGRALLDHALREVRTPALVRVVTFCEGHAGGEDARAFYTSLAFAPGETLPPTGQVGCRQVYRLRLPG